MLMMRFTFYDIILEIYLFFIKFKVFNVSSVARNCSIVPLQDVEKRLENFFFLFLFVISFFFFFFFIFRINPTLLLDDFAAICIS